MRVCASSVCFTNVCMYIYICMYVRERDATFRISFRRRSHVPAVTLIRCVIMHQLWHQDQLPEFGGEGENGFL